MDKTAGSTRGLRCQTLTSVTTHITVCVVPSLIKSFCLKYKTVSFIGEMIHFTRHTFEFVV